MEKEENGLDKRKISIPVWLIKEALNTYKEILIEHYKELEEVKETTDIIYSIVRNENLTPEEKVERIKELLANRW